MFPTINSSGRQAYKWKISLVWKVICQTLLVCVPVMQRPGKFQDDVSPWCIVLEINKISLVQKKGRHTSLLLCDPVLEVTAGPQPRTERAATRRPCCFLWTQYICTVSFGIINNCSTCFVIISSESAGLAQSMWLLLLSFQCISWWFLGCLLCTTQIQLVRFRFSDLPPMAVYKDYLVHRLVIG